MRAKELLFTLRSGLQYYFDAKTVHEIDSPFIFDLMKQVLEKSTQKSKVQFIESRRNDLYIDKKMIDRMDLGQGSRNTYPSIQSSPETIGTWAKSSSISPYFGCILHRLIDFFKPGIMLELGTAAGISGAYMASASALPSRMFTIEGDPASSVIARQTFNLLGLDQVQVLEGAFKDILPTFFLQHPTVDFALIDGHHHGPSLMDYILLIQSHLTKKQGVIIVDDIRWSRDMYAAWQKIKLDPFWTASLDLYRIGILIHNPDLTDKLNYKIISRRYKPLTLGLFR